ncbi:hypothetical protein JCM11641_008274 [Rhodosporidiobolus odoratus]
MSPSARSKGCPVHLVPPPTLAQLQAVSAEQAAAAEASLHSKPVLQQLFQKAVAGMLSSSEQQSTVASAQGQQLPTPSPTSSDFSGRAGPLSPVLEEDEDLLAAFPAYSANDLKTALEIAERAASAEVARPLVKITPPTEHEQTRKGIWREVFGKDEDGEEVRSRKDPTPPDASRRHGAPTPIYLDSLPASASTSTSSSPSSASFLSETHSSRSSLSAGVSSRETTPATSCLPSPTDCSFPSTRASSSQGAAKARGNDLSRVSTHTVDSTNSAWSGKSTRRFLRKLFLPNQSGSTSAASSAPSSVPSSAPISRSSSFSSTSATKPSNAPFSKPGSNEVLAAVSARLVVEAAAKDPGAKTALKELKRLEKAERKERERRMEERLEREWREKRALRGKR